MSESRLEQDLCIQIENWDVFWELADQVQDGILARRYTRAGEILTTQKEIGIGLGITKERVRQKLAKALRLMRHPRRKQQYIAY